MLTIQVNSASLEQALGEARQACLSTRPLMARLGKGLEKELRGHFMARDREGNASGWPRRHFWNREIRASTALTAIDDAQATVTVASPAFAQKLYGGMIKPKRAKLLAIPARSEAYAAGSPREGGMKGLFRPKGRSFLMDRRGLVQYWLVPSVTQKADPRALPNLDVLAERLRVDAERWIGQQIRRSGA